MGRLLSLAVIAALVAGGVYWWRLGGDAADDLVVRLGEPQCQGTRVEQGVAVVARPMRCTYPVTIRNGGDAEVRVDRLGAGELDEDGGSLVESDTASEDERVGERLEPGDAVRRELVVVFREDGASPTGRLRLEAPEVRGSLYVRPFTATPERQLVLRVPRPLGTAS